MRRALVTGVTGQDGTYLAELLLGHGYAVLGTSRAPRLPAANVDESCMTWDLRDESVLRQAIEDFRPDEIYNCAAYSSGDKMFDSPVAMGDINGLSVTRILAAIVASGRPIRFCQASSSEVFGAASQSPQDESTAPRPRTPYGSAKLYADSVVDVFRRAHGVFACSAILYNHESPRRRSEFVTKKVAEAAARICLGSPSKVVLGRLDARRDWGHARDYVEAMWLMLQQPAPDTYVIATGKTHSIADLCEVAFSHVGLNYEDHVVTDPSLARPSEAVQLVGDAGKAERILNWQPRTTFEELVHEMVDAALVRHR